MEDCLFCKIANGVIPTEFIYEDERVVAFKDIDPQAPVHILIVPKKHYDSILSVESGDDIVSYIGFIACKIARENKIDESGFRLVNNCGVDGGQSVRHIHYHLLGGRSMKWPPG